MSYKPVDDSAAGESNWAESLESGAGADMDEAEAPDAAASKHKYFLCFSVPCNFRSV